MEREKTIGYGTARAFLVCDDSFEELEPLFVKFLWKEGFKIAWHKGQYAHCPWMYINISRKQYAYGMPGVNIVDAIGNHAITLEEFKTIYDIYKKYEGKDRFVFHKERFDYDKNPDAPKRVKFHEVYTRLV